MSNCNIVLGASFSPEYCEHIGIKDPLESLKFLHEELGIKVVRLGLRWNKIDNGKELTLEYYRRYLDYLFENDFIVCLNVGPIKVFRWPEEHIPLYLHEYYTSKINESSELAYKSREYFSKLLNLLDKDYGSEMKRVCFQIENEPFNRFGHLAAKISLDYVFSIAEMLFSKYPNTSLMINSAGRTNLNKIVRLFEKILSRRDFYPRSLILGINYYFKIPHTLPFIKVLDPIKFSYPFDMSLTKLHKKSRKMGFNIEVSEGQFEPWGVQNTRGNSYEDLLYLMEKCKNIFPADMNPKVVRLWGVEELTGRFLCGNEEEVHRKIAEKITSINSNTDQQSIALGY